MDMSIYPEWILKAFEKNGKKPRIITSKELDKNILYGTFGVHANESENDILMRKIPETDGKLGSLWGLRIGNKKGFSDYTDFCGNIKGDVYALLKSTKSPNNSNGAEFLKCMYNGEEKVLAEYGIKVIGSEIQDRALVVEEYCLYEEPVSLGSVRNCYKRYKSDKGICPRTPLSMLERNNNVGLNLNSCKTSEARFAIVLKLKAPYVVQCFDYQYPKK